MFSILFCGFMEREDTIISNKKEGRDGTLAPFAYGWKALEYYFAAVDAVGQAGKRVIKYFRGKENV